MRIVKTEEFLKLPDGTVYMDFNKLHIFGDLCMKGDTLGGNDFSYDVISCNADCTTIELIDACGNSQTSIPIDFDDTKRYGTPDKDRFFAIYEEKDVRNLIFKLKTGLGEI